MDPERKMADITPEEAALMSEDEWRALMTSKEINDLPDSDFAYIEPGGEKDDEGKTTPRSLRHYPIHDKAHAKNALARASAQIKDGSGKSKEIAEKAMPKIKAACKKFGIDVEDDKPKKSLGRAASDEARAARDEMRGVRETRRMPLSGFEIREVPNGSGGTNLEFEGYASVTCSDEEDEAHSYEMEDWVGPYRESILRGAFSKTLTEGADVAFLVNHGAGGGVTMARTKPGTLKLHEDLVGLHVAATLNAARPDVQILKMAVDDGALDEMSFAFRTVRQKWSYEQDNGVIDWRYIQEVNLDKGDVSPVNYGANPHTGGLVSMRSAMTMLSGRGLTLASFAESLKEIRAGATISTASREVLEPILQHLAAIDELVDADQPTLADLLGVANPDEDDDDSDEALSLALATLPDYGAIARARLTALA